MTSPHKNSLPKGLSLLEVMVAIFIFGIIATIAIVMYSGQADAKRLNTARSKFQSLASTGQSRAFLKQSPHRLNFTSPHEVLLETISEDQDGEVSYTTLNSLKTDEVTIALRRWGAKENNWITPKENALKPTLWNFSSAGLCEPVSVRLTQGDNWMILHIDPLTGRIRDEESYIAK